MSMDLDKGKTAPLEYTREGRQRVTVGISWDTPEIMPERPEQFNTEMDDDSNHYNVELDVTVGFVQETYDLDLICLIYNNEFELVDAVSPSPEENVDLSGAIYHSGDDTAGVSAGDDEQISIELLNLPDYVHHMAFLAIIQSGHTFGQVLNAECRVADGKTNTDLLNFNLGQKEADGSEKTACAMVSLSRDPEHDWIIRKIAEFRIDKEVADWGTEIQRMIAR